MVDPSAGILGLEWIDGKSVRRLIPASVDQERKDQSCNSMGPSENVQEADALLEFGISLGAPTFLNEHRALLHAFYTDTLMELIGIEIAKMHHADIIHGDLTTSNMMLRHPSSFASHLTNPPSTELVGFISSRRLSSKFNHARF
jgi:serine/threonine protein kinase